MKSCCVFSLESPHRGNSNEYTQYNILNEKKKQQEMLQYVTDAPEGPLCDTPSHYALSFCDVLLNLFQ